MKRYEYRTLYESETMSFDVEVNAAGSQGWRVVAWTINDNGRASVIIEREITNDSRL